MIPASAIVRELVAAGVTGDALVAVLERMEAAANAQRSAGAVRQARYRVSKKEAERNGDVTRNAPPSPLSPPSMVSPITPSLTTPTIPPNPDIRAVAVATRPAIDEDFEKFWRAYPKRDGSSPKAPARKLFLAALKAGTEAGAIVGGAGRYAAAESERVGTPYIAQAVTWLRQRRWEDYPASADRVGDAAFGWRPGLPTSEELRAKYAREANGEGTGNRLEQSPSVVESGLRLCEGDRGLARDRSGQRGTQKLGEVLRQSGLDAKNVSDASDLDGSLSMARVAGERR